jgi:hypothetical protein
MRERYISEYRFRHGVRSAHRAARASGGSDASIRATLAALESSLERYGVVADPLVLEIAAGRLEGIATKHLRHLAKDVRVELIRRGAA